MLEYLTLILLCQLAGEFAVKSADVPLPGPVAGMILLFVFLLINGKVPAELENVSKGLLNNLSLMFVPAGVGIMAHFDLLRGNLWPLFLAILISTVLTIVVTALVMQALNKGSEEFNTADSKKNHE